MNIEEIRKLLEPMRGSDSPSTTDYQRLRTEEWRCLSLAFCFYIFGFTALTSRDILPPWGIGAMLALFLGSATVFALRGLKCRKACGKFELYCPGSVNDLEKKIAEHPRPFPHDADECSRN